MAEWFLDQGCDDATIWFECNCSTLDSIHPKYDKEKKQWWETDEDGNISMTLRR